MRASADWWVTTANTDGTNGLTCLPKHGGARDNKFLVTHPMTDRCCFASAIVRRSAPTAETSNSERDMNLFVCNALLYGDSVNAYVSELCYHRATRKYTTCLVHTLSSRNLPMLKGYIQSYIEVRNFEFPKKIFYVCMKKFSSR
jgi:hypothetical protein